MALTKIDDRGITYPLDLIDNEKIRLGTGNDLEIYHDGTHSRIVDHGSNATSFQTGELRIHDLAANEYIAKFVANGAVELYYDNSKKFETNSAGATVTGSFGIGTTSPAALLHISHSGTSTGTGTNICASLRSGASGRDQCIQFADSATSAYLGMIGGDIYIADSSSTEKIRFKSDGTVKVVDNAKFIAGAGDDLLIWHDGTDSIIRNTTGDLYIQNSASDIEIAAEDNVYIKNYDGQTYARFMEDGASELYYDDVLKFSTMSNGVNLHHGNLNNSGHVYLGDGYKAHFGTGQDLKIYHDGTSAYIKSEITGHFNIDVQYDLYIRKQDGTEPRAKFHNDGSVELYYDGSKKLNTHTDGVEILGKLYMADSKNIELGNSQDLKIYHNGSNSYLANGTGGLVIRGAGGSDFIHLEPKTDENGILIKPDGAVELYYDHGLKLETLTAGVQVWGHLRIPDSNGTTDKLEIGNGQDLQIYHNGTHSFIQHTYGSGNFFIESAAHLSFKVATNETAILANANGAVELYYDNSKKFETFANGIKLYDTQGDLIGEGFDGGFNFTSLVYVNELRLMDSEKIQLGAGLDLSLYHDGSNSKIENATGELRLQNSTWIKYQSDSGHIFYNASASETLARFNNNAACELYYDNAKHFETTATGVSWGTTRLRCDDNGMIELGTGQDLQIYHDGSDSYIKDSGTGKLRLLTDSFRVSNAADSENLIAGEENGAVSLFYNDSKKFETASYGTYVSGRSKADNFGVNDAGKYYAGAGDDLQIYHDGSNSYINNTTGILRIRDSEIRLCNTDNETYFMGAANGAAKLYYDDTVKLETASNGIQLLDELGINDNKAAMFGDSDDMKIYHDGSHSYINNVTNTLYIRSADTYIQDETGDETNAKFINNGAVELYYDNVRKFRTTAEGAIVDGSLYIADNKHLILNDANKAKFGNGEDLQIYHDSTNSNNKIQFDQQLLFRSHGSGSTYENSAAFNPNGSVDLYYDDVKKFQTESDGVRVLGDSKIWFDAWQGRLDRNWDDFPSITITPSTTYGSSGKQAEFRVHGQSGALGGYGSGSDFSIDFRVDGAYQTGSDRRRKSNIEDITGALATVKQLTGKKFNIINRQGDLDPNKGTKKQFGLIAQECEDIIPEVITFHPDENTPNENGWCSAYGLDYGQLTPLLINAIKELSAEVETLKTKVAALESA